MCYKTLRFATFSGYIVNNYKLSNKGLLNQMAPCVQL